MAAKKSKGRQKLEMVKMKNEINLQVTFSKRRFGLFKKASELVSLCGAEVALIVFSPGGKVYTFGHPTVQTIIHRYLGGGVGVGGGSGGGGVGPSNVAAGVDGHNNSADGDQRAMLAARLGNELNDKESQLEKEKKVGEIMGEKIKNSPLYKRWGKASVDEMDMSELLQFKAALEKLKMDIDAMKMKKSMQMLNEMMALDPPNPNLFFGGNDNFGDPYFGFNNLNPNDGYFLPTFDPFFAPVPNQNPWEESSPEGAITLVGGVTTLAGGATTTLAEGATTLGGEVTTSIGGVTALAGRVTTLGGEVTTSIEGVTALAGGATPLVGGATTLVGGATTLAGETTMLAGGATTLAGGATMSAGGTTTLGGGVTTFAGGATTSARGATTLDGGATTFASSSYPPPGFLY